jgi:type III secretory pathway component EscV
MSSATSSAQEQDLKSNRHHSVMATSDSETVQVPAAIVSGIRKMTVVTRAITANLDMMNTSIETYVVRSLMSLDRACHSLLSFSLYLSSTLLPWPCLYVPYLPSHQYALEFITCSEASSCFGKYLI